MLCPICYDYLVKEDFKEHLVNYHKFSLDEAMKIDKVWKKLEDNKR